MRNQFSKLNIQIRPLRNSSDAFLHAGRFAHTRGSVRLPLLLYPPTAGKHPGFFARTSERSGTLLDFLEAVSLNPPNCDSLLKYGKYSNN